MDRNLAANVARGSIIDVAGRFQRHASPKVRTLAGSTAGGRWGLPNTYPVIYLGRPVDSVVVEAYRRLVDGVEGMTADLVGPRTVFEVQVRITQVLDLRDDETLALVGLDQPSLIGGHGPCQRVGQAAHQLGLHGILAPAATELGETLALFERHLPEHELPVIIGEGRWESLPPDPRTSEQRARQLPQLS
ncbi:MAG TPA: RES family NAD+ phosphorylase [Solirubrobacteraceae bacterium]|nr:RES family NAD+ phosphorylase [Solirubrobacteraceae bacterium]